MKSIGIPRALLYFYYYPLWRAFFTRLGLQVVVSPETNKKIMDAGVKATLSEVCLPVKIYFGHVIALADKVDYLFVPRIIKVEPKEYICPKFMGLPDMLRARLKEMPFLIDAPVDLAKDETDAAQSWINCFQDVGRILARDQLLVERAIKEAFESQYRFQRRLQEGLLLPSALALEEDDSVCEVAATSQQSFSLRIGLLGHPYNLYDPYINMNLIKKLHNMGVAVVTPESLPIEDIEEQAGRLPKRMFWTLGKRMVGSALNFFASERLDGLIYLTSFGCGPESLVEELVAGWAKKQGNLPLMMLTLDEHTGEAGMNTRLEAFTEMIRRRKMNAYNLPSHGKHLHSH